MATDSRPESAPHAGRTRQSTVAVVLAAGAGTRFRSGTENFLHKLSAKLSPGGPTILETAIDHALRAAIGPVVVVTGAAPDIVPDHLRHAVTIQHNPRWHEGQITSVHAALDAARALGADAVVIGLGDQPFIEPEAWQAVAGNGGPIVVATYEGRRGNPVRLAADVWDLLPTSGDEGGRALMRVRPDLVREVACSGSPADIDTAEDLRRWQNS